MMSLKTKRMLVVAAFGFTLAVLLFPEPVIIYYAVLRPAKAPPGTHPNPTVAIHHIAANWGAWVAHRGYLPWTVWAALVLRHPHGLIVVLAVALGVAGLFAYMARGKVSATWGGPPAAGKGQHGTAHWRGVRELVTGLALWASFSKEPQPSGILVGQAGPGKAYVLERDEHVLLIGSTRSGKSRRIILPSIGVIGTAAKESMVIGDPKGELYAHSAAWLRSRGYDVVRFDLREPSRGNRWNPLASITQALAEGREDHAMAAARDIGHLFAWSSEYTGGDPVWPQGQEALFTAFALAVASGEPPGNLRPLKGGKRWIQWPTPEEKHMGSVYAALAAAGPGGIMLDAWMAHFPMLHPVRQAWAPVGNSVDRMRASFLSGAASNISLFADFGIKWLTATQDHDLADPGRKPTAVFLVIPDERATRYPPATLYIQQTVQALTQLADASGGRLPTRVNFILDEFGNLPQLRDFDHFVTVSLGRGMRFVLALQSLAQLKRHYKDAAQTIRGNCGTWLYLLTSDLETAKEISGMCGDYTTTGETYSMPKVYWTSSTTPGHATNTNTLMGRPLVKPDELLRWPADTSLVLQGRESPAKLPLPDLSAWVKTWPGLQGRADAPPEQPMEAVPVWWPGKEWEPTQVPQNGKTDGGSSRDVSPDIDGQGTPVEELGSTPLPASVTLKHAMTLRRNAGKEVGQAAPQQMNSTGGGDIGG